MKKNELKPTTWARDRWALAFAWRVMAWMIPAALVWLLLTPVYNRFLTKSAENLVRLSERPSVTRLQVKDVDYFLISRVDIPNSKGFLSSVRVTDTHFPLIMTIAFFLAVPTVSWRQRFEALGWAFLISIFFHIFALFLWVKFVYATQLGEWSLANYSVFGQNFWGMAKHLADLPFKLGLPFLLWSFFFLGELLPLRAAPTK